MKLRQFLIVISIFFFLCCQKHFDIAEVYKYNNETNADIKVYAIWYKTFDLTPNKEELFSIDKNSSHIIHTTGLEIQVGKRRDAEAFSIFPFPRISYDTIFVVFNEKRILNYSNNQLNNCLTNNNIFCKESFSVKEISRFEYEYTYTFTEADYRNATPLVFGEGFVGSVWRCTEGAGLQEGLLYSELRFVSENEVEGWAHLEEEEEPELYFTAFYTLEGETLTISEDGDSFNATLNEDYTGLLTNIDGEGECVFVKQ